MFCPLKAMTDLAELWVARTMDIKASKTCPGRTDLCNSIPGLYPMGSTASQSSTLSFQHQPLKICRTPCQYPLWVNSSLPENCLFKQVCVFSRLEWSFTSLFPWPIGVLLGAEKQQESMQELGHSPVEKAAFVPVEQSRKTSNTEARVPAVAHSDPEAPFRKWTQKSFRGRGFQLFLKYVITKSFFPPERIFGFTELLKLISFFKRGTILPFSLQSKLVNQAVLWWKYRIIKGLSQVGWDMLIIFLSAVEKDCFHIALDCRCLVDIIRTSKWAFVLWQYFN